MSEQSETPVFDLLARMTADSLDTSSLDAETLFLVRLAALVAVDAPATSYLLSLGAFDELGIELSEVQGVLAAVAPIVGTPRVIEASGNMVEALGFALEMEALEDAIEDVLEDEIALQVAEDLAVAELEVEADELSAELAVEDELEEIAEGQQRND